MDGLPLADRIRALDEADALRLAQRLALAERSLLSLPVEAVDFPQRTKAKDGGVDGRTSFPSDVATPFPRGVRLWQVKSGHTQVRAAREFSPPKRGGDKWVVQELRKGGVGYVLLWTYDPVDPDAEEIRQSFTDEVRKVAPSADVSFLFLSQIVALVRRHPGIALSAMGLDGEGLLSPDLWQRQFEGSFQTEPGRVAVMEAIRAHATTPGAGRRVTRVYGDAGVGRSRVVFEAINLDGIRERCVIATKASSTAVPELVANDAEASVVLVLDPASDDDVAALRPFIAAADGRLVVIAVQERDGSDSAKTGHLVVPPLDRMSIRRLIDPVNDGAKADEGLVQMAGGYPGLALQIAAVTRRREPGAELVSVASDPDIQSRLARLVPDPEDRKALAALAPFGRVGFVGESRRQLVVLTTALGLDDLTASARLERFQRRLLSRSGDSLRVSPDIVAVWLSDEACAIFGRRLVDAATSVPESLASALLDRLAGMPGSAAAQRVAKELSQTDRFKVTTAESLDLLRGRMLLAMAVLDPAEGLKRINELLTPGVTRAAVMSTELLAAIEELLWEPATCAGAIALLFELARNDLSERTFGPRKLFEQVFQLILSGTQASYMDRVYVARRLLEGADEAGRRLIAAALGGAFDLSATRGVTLRGRVSLREDWYPTTVAERQASIKAAWDLLIELSRDEAVRPEAASSAAHAVRACLLLGRGALLEADLPKVDWSSTERGLLLHEMRLAREHDKRLAAEDRELLVRTMRELEGSTFESRLHTAMGAEPYQLESYSETSAQTILDRLAADMLDDRSALEAAIHASSAGNPHTVQLLFRKFGASAADDAYAALLDPATSPAARIGFVAGRDAAGSDVWATATLRSWMADAASVAHVPALVAALAPSDDRVNIAVDAVLAGADRYELSLLAYGSRATSLAPTTIVRVVEALEGSGGVVLEHTLGILAHWLENSGQAATPQVVEAALRVVDASFEDDGLRGGMAGLYRSLILRRVPDDIARLLPRLLSTLRTEDELDDSDLALICRATAIDVAASADAIARLVSEAVSDRGVHMWAWRASRAHLLSALASCTDPDTVVHALDRAGMVDPRPLFDHVAVHAAEKSLDPMFQRLLELGGDDPDVWAAAAREFAVPEGGLWGNESDHFRARAQVAADLAVSSGESLIQRWASWVSGQLIERATEAERREADTEDN